MAYRGFFKPKNPKKYLGDPTNIQYRSMWELKCMLKFDQSDSVTAWSSEEIAIPYFCPVRKRWRRYFPDFYVQIYNGKKKTTREYLIEVKPHKETKEPKKLTPKRTTSKRQIREIYRYANNRAKWDAAENYCADHKWNFQIWTEKNCNF